MKRSAEKALKARNMPWLVSLATVDLVVLLLIVAPELVNLGQTSHAAVSRLLTTTLLPVTVLVLASVIPHSIKAALVYWRVSNVLPGHRAFSEYGPADVRFDMSALEKTVGQIPSDPLAQNSLWFRLYREVSQDAPVIEAHKSYLLFRDMAAISALLLVFACVAGPLFGIPAIHVVQTIAFLGAQYLITSLAARHSGVRFVTNVLAAHATKS